MNCADVEILLCDYTDGALDTQQREKLERHLTECTACGELARDVAAARAYLRNVEAVAPPDELVTRILFQIPTAGEATPSPRRGLRALVSGWLQPILQPRFAMGMAMTILSFSMVGRFAGIPDRPLTPADLDPVKVWASIEDRAHRTWNRALKYYENLRLVYEIQSRLKEWTEQEEEARKSQAVGSGGAPAGRPANTGEGEKQ